MMNRLFPIFLTLWSCLSWGTNTFFGNSGEGYLVIEKVYLRDFVSQGEILIPHIGLQTDVKIEDSISRSGVANLEVDRSLLARKIVDLNKMLPFFGDIVLDVINSYEWQFTERELPLSPLDLPTEAEPRGSKRVSLANRYQNKIFIQRGLWLKMDPTQRLGLIIHEAVYSLLKPRCTSQGCDQLPAQARALVHRIFSDPNKFSAEAISKLLRSSLDIPASATKICVGGKGPSIRMSIHSKAVDVVNVEASDLIRAEDRDLFVQQVCKSLLGWQASAFPLEISTTLIRPPYGLSQHYYSQIGFHYQMNLSIFYRHVAETYSLTFESQAEAKDSCLAMVQQGMNGFFSLNSDDSGGFSHQDVCLIHHR